MTHPRRERREEILDVAERLFRERGYQLVSLLDIAREVGIRKPSIYHHFAEGKEQLYVAVHRRMFESMGRDLAETLGTGGTTLGETLATASRWFLAQPPVFLLSMIHHDMPELSEEHRQELSRISYQALIEPLLGPVRRAQERGEVRNVDAHTIAGAFLAILESNTIAARAGFGGKSLEAMMNDSIQLLLHGALLR